MSLRKRILTDDGSWIVEGEAPSQPVEQQIAYFKGENAKLRKKLDDRDAHWENQRNVEAINMRDEVMAMRKEMKVQRQELERKSKECDKLKGENDQLRKELKEAIEAPREEVKKVVKKKVTKKK